MVIRPTGLVDLEVDARPTRHQVDDLMDEIRQRTEKNERVLVTTLTKKMAEDLTDYLLENGLKVRYLHSEIETLERVAILRDLMESASFAGGAATGFCRRARCLASHSVAEWRTYAVAFPQAAELSLCWAAAGKSESLGFRALEDVERRCRHWGSAPFVPPGPSRISPS